MPSGFLSVSTPDLAYYANEDCGIVLLSLQDFRLISARSIARRKHFFVCDILVSLHFRREFDYARLLYFSDGVHTILFTCVWF